MASLDFTSQANLAPASTTQGNQLNLFSLLLQQYRRKTDKHNNHLTFFEARNLISIEVLFLVHNTLGSTLTTVSVTTVQE